MNGWTDRYFVLTETSLHYFKREDGDDLFGQRRGAFAMDDIHLTEKDKKKFEFSIFEAKYVYSEWLLLRLAGVFPAV